jgi:subtilisin family serine protease
MRHRSAWITPEEAEEAVRAGRGRGVKIAIIDSGIELSHPALGHLRLVDDIAFEISNAGTVSTRAGGGIDNFGHGTAIAAIVKRTAPEAQLGSFRVLDTKNLTKYIMIEKAARLALDLGYHIINCSFGSPADLSTIGHFKRWIDLSYRYGVHVVAACNNYDFRSAEWPGYFPSVITVDMTKGETDDVFFRWDIPPSGDFAQHLVEFAARGVDLDLPWKGGGSNKATGSSFAAPHVSGILARLLSRFPRLKPPIAKALLQEIALPWQNVAPCSVAP